MTKTSQVTPCHKRKNSIVKSPSDITLYRPALRKDIPNVSDNRLPIFDNSAQKNVNSGIIDKISTFVEKMRVSSRSRSRDPETNRSLDCENRTSRSPCADRSDESHRDPAEQLILDAEKFKASVSAPSQGKDTVGLSEAKLDKLLKYIEDTQDEEFYHVTSHVDLRIKQKIQRGEFVELELLIPKNRGQLAKEDDRLQQFVTKSGSTYWAPPDREVRISNIRKWEQSFHVYAAIYCQSNPGASC